MAAEGVLRDAGVESIGRQVVASADDLEVLGRNDQVQDALLRADRAVALAREIEVARHPEPHPPAMTAALVFPAHGADLTSGNQPPEVVSLCRYHGGGSRDRRRAPEADRRRTTWTRAASSTINAGASSRAPRASASL